MSESGEFSAYALGIRDHRGRLEFLRRGVFPGNLMRTTDPHYAWTWPTVRELELWLDLLPESSKDQLADRELLIVPFSLVCAQAQQSVTLKTIPSPPRPTEAPAGPPTETKRKPVVSSRPAPGPNLFDAAARATKGIDDGIA
jgi:hypothetical protein